MLKWGQKNIDRVHGLVFITYRTAKLDEQKATDMADHEVDLSKLSYVKDHFDEEFVTSPEVYELLQEVCPEYDAAGYLGRHCSARQLQVAGGRT